MHPIEIPSVLKYGNVTEHFERVSQEFPEKLAIIDKDGEISFGQLLRRVKAAQHHFERSGLKSGDRILVFVPMSIDLYVAVLALFRMGCTAVFLDEWSNISRLKLACKVADCRGFIGFSISRVVGFFIGDIRKIPIWISSKNLGIGGVNSMNDGWGMDQSGILKGNHYFESGNTSPEKIKPKEIDSNCDTALITFTTGSTGVPKAALRTHEFLHQQFLALQTTLKTTKDIVDMPVLPIVLLINLGLGVTSVLVNWNAKKPFKLDVERVLDRIIKFGVNRIIASPYFIERMSDYLISNEIQCDSLKSIFSGGAPVFPSSAVKWVNAFSDTDIQVVYGSTEAEPISMISAKNLSETHVTGENGLCVGKVERVAQVRILKIGTELELPFGKVGEIVVSGKHVLRNYYGSNSAQWVAESKIFEGDVCWHRTGDAGFLKEDGSLYLVGRCGQIINWQGDKLYPFLVEDILKGIKGVEIGTVMEMNGEIIYFVELNSEWTNNKNTSNCIQELIIKNGLPSGEIKCVKIPRDPRHFSKIDYGKLKRT